MRATVVRDGRVETDAFLQGPHMLGFDRLERIRIAAPGVVVVAVDVQPGRVLSRIQSEPIRVHQGQHVEGVGLEQTAHRRIGGAVSQEIVGDGQDRFCAGGFVTVMGSVREDGWRIGLASCIDDEIGHIAALRRFAIHLVCGDAGKAAATACK